MPSLCAYRMCHNLGSSSFGGYCNEAHQIRGEKDEQKEREEKLAIAAAKKDEDRKRQSSKKEKD